MTNKEKISLGIAVGAAAVVWFLERKLNASPTSGIGDLAVWNKGLIKNWLAYEHYAYPEKIVVYLNPAYYVNDGCVEVESYTDRNTGYSHYYRSFSIRKKDIDYLRELCERHNVEYIEL